MNAISKAVDEVKFRIPRPILEAVFIKRAQDYRVQPISLDAHLINEVIRPRVMVDCDLIGGTEAFIGLGDIEVTRTNNYTSVYRIPKSKTNGRTITSVLNITFSDPTANSNYGSSTGCQNTELLTVGQAMLDAYGTMPITSTAKVQLIGENVVMVRDTVQLPANIYLRCILANDQAMSHLQMRSYRAFAQLVEYAVKAYIFNEYVVQMDIGELYGGQTLGRFKDIIDGYADAEELYQTYLRENMEKIFLMNDTEQFTRFMRSIVGGQR